MTQIDPLYIGRFCEEYAYPAEAVQELVKAAWAIVEDPPSAEIFRQNQQAFLEGSFQNGQQVLEPLQKAVERTGFHPYTVHLLFYIWLSQPVREIYQKRGISLEIYRDSMLDLKWKLLECRKLYGIWGSFVAWWFDGFINLSRFALGRLQFEQISFDREYRGPEGRLHPGDPVINLHIPSSGPLTHESCMGAFQKASMFYQKDFLERPIPFVCQSWLLFPEHRRMLPASSHIRHFLEYFHILEWGYDPEGGDLWRIFGCFYDGDIQKLPRDTSLRRAYAERLGAGEPPGWGYGLCFFNGRQIL